MNYKNSVYTDTRFKAFPDDCIYSTYSLINGGLCITSLRLHFAQYVHSFYFIILLDFSVNHALNIDFKSLR